MHPWKPPSIWLDGWRLDLDGQAIGYRAAHKRVAAKRSPAWVEVCADCGGAGEEWSYDGLDPDEIESPDGLAYSLDVDRYAARCKPCHRAYDRRLADGRRNGRGDSVEWTKLGEIGSFSGVPEPLWNGRRRWREGSGLHDDPVTDVRQLLGMMISPQTAEDLDIVALWIAATHLSGRGIGWYIPRLALVAPSYGAGKSTLLEYVEKLSHKGHRVDGNITDALIPRLLQGHGFVTLCFDEVEKTLKPENVGAAAILNSGWKRDASTLVNQPTEGGGWAPAKIGLFAPVCLAGNGLRLAADTRQRTITVRLARNDDPAHTDWEAINPVLDRLRARLEEWADYAAGDARVKRPAIPDGVKGRDRDRWSIMLSGARGAGGWWLDTVKRLVLADVAERAAEAAAIGVAPNEQLAYDLVSAWEVDQDGERVPRMPTRRLVERLVLVNPDLWGASTGRPLTEKGLGGKLSQFYGVQPTRWREGIQRHRGYALADIRRVWAIYGIGDITKLGVGTVASVPRGPLN